MDTFTDKQEMISAKSLAIQRRGLTKRAPDTGDSGAIPSIFPVGRLRRPRPSAGNANRWAVHSVEISEQLWMIIVWL